jgi:16S rRNA processing protein RimM
LSRVLLGGTGPGAANGIRRVESARAYRDRLVLKLAGIDDANQASNLRGCDVSALAEDLPKLPEGTYWVERLVGAQVMDSILGDIGRVMDVVETGGVDLLLVKDVSGRETLVPLVRQYVAAIDEEAGTIRVVLPAGLRGLDEDEARGVR